MPTFTGLMKNDRGVYHLRRRIPKELQDFFKRGQFYKVSLGTSDPANAKPAWAIANGEYEKKLADYRAMLANSASGHLSLEEAQGLVERHLKTRSASGFASGGTRVAFLLRSLDEAVSALEGTAAPAATWVSPGERIAQRRAQLLANPEDELSPDAVVRFAAEHAAGNRPWGEVWFEFQRRAPRRRWRPLLSDAVTSLKRDLKLAGGLVPGIDEPLAEALSMALKSPEVNLQIPLAPSARRRSQPKRLRPDMKLAELCGLWNASRKPRPKSLDAAKTAVAYFTSYIGDIGIGEITSADCFEFRDAVAMLPRGMPRAHRKLAFVDLHAIYAARHDVTRISPPSVKKYLGFIQAMLAFAFQEQLITNNPAARILVDGYSKKSIRRPFTRDELARLFAAPLFTQPWSKRQSRSTISDATLRWLFLLGLLSGGRIEELGQVLLADIKADGGVWYIDVHDYVADDAGETTKSVKTDSSVRVLPLHPKLISLGFIDYVTSLRTAGATKLFPDLRADKHEVWTKEASKRAGRLIDKEVSEDIRLVFHSFRHSFKDLCRDANVPADVHDQLTGHAPATAGGRYGLGRAIANLHAHLKTIDFGFIDWDKVEAASRLSLPPYLRSALNCLCF